jgi:hypothetical protein
MSSARRRRAAVLGCLAALSLLGTNVPAAVATAGAPSAGAGASDRTFSHPTVIDNRYLPLVPGTKFVLEGRVDDSPHQVVLVVTDLVKVINGVLTVVLWDRDFSDGELAEAELAFQAQDDGGTVWNFGEYPEEYEDGQFVGAPSTWIDGIDGAQAGIHMLAEPRVGRPSYVQGYSPTIDFFDVARVFKTDKRLCVGGQCYTGVLVIDEWSPLDPESGHQLKYYAPGVGNIKIAAAGGVQQEFLDLVSVSRLGEADLAQARSAALRLDRRAYRFSDVYRSTPPAYQER